MEDERADKAAVLEAAGTRDAAVLATAGSRDAAVLASAGDRDAAALAAGGERDERALVTAGRREAAVLATAGQRSINLIWENTQRWIALSVIGVSLLVSAGLAAFGRWLGTPEMQLASIVFLTSVANLVTGFYFGRTNHARTGGVGGDNASGDR